MSPVRTCWPMLASPKMTSPVAIAGPDDQADAPGLLEPVVEDGQRALALGGRLDRAQRVVVVRTGSPKTATIASPMIFSIVPPCDSKTAPHLVEVEGQDLAQRLRIEALAERGRALQVGVDDRREAADLGRPPAPPRGACRTTRTRRYRSGIVGTAGRARRGCHRPESSGRTRTHRQPTRTHGPRPRTMATW